MPVSNALVGVLLAPLILATSAFAQTVPPPPPKPPAMQQYEQVWSEASAGARLTKIHAFWEDSSTYVDPAASVQGPAELNQMIENFMKGFPGAILESDPFLAMGNAYTWNWRIFDAAGNLVVAGRDYAELNGTGHISKLVGFWEQPTTEYTNRRVVAAYFDALFRTGDFKTMATLIHPDAEYHQAEGLPYGGTFKGFENWVTMFTHAGRLYDLQIAEAPTYAVNGTKDGVVISFVIRCTSKKSGRTITMPISEHFHLRDGKIVSIRPFYFDTKAFAAFLQ